MGDFFVSADELGRSIGTADQPRIFDVRRRAIFDQALDVLPTARWREHTTARVWGRDLDAGLPIVVYCVHGHSVSQLAAAELRAMGRDARTLSGGIAAWQQAGLPTILKSALAARDENEPSRWVTRVRPKIDRIACPWLVSRFIDRDAIFQFVEPAHVLEVAREQRAHSYDIDGADFTHDSPLCTFDTLIRVFAITDPALAALATIVRGADTARMDLAPEAAGLLAISLGNSALSGADDHAALARGFPMYDALLAWLRLAAREAHGGTANTGGGDPDMDGRNDPPAPLPTFSQALRVWLRIGLLSFGGPAGQIALMHRELVEERRWIDEPRYLNALNFCMLLPGPEAMQLATYVGWRMHGLKGGLAAGLLFVMPGALLMLALSMIYGAWGKVPLVEALFVGIKAAVLAIVVEALLRIARRALKGSTDWLIAAAGFIAIFLFSVPFPIIVLAAALIGYFRATSSATGKSVATPAVMVTPGETARTTLIWLAIWVLPLAALVLALPGRPVLADIALFFSKMAVVTFGGAYAVLAYVAQDGVQTYGWLNPGEMLDGLGLAETTPGPLILVNAFVGYLGALRASGGSMLIGTLGWAATLWATFAPCFLWIMAGAPYVERLNNEPRLKAALAGVTAAVVGVVLNLTVWFALNVLFRRIDVQTLGPLHLQVPDPSSVSPVALGLAAVAGLLLFVIHRGVVTTLAVCGGLALAIHAIGV